MGDPRHACVHYRLPGHARLSVSPCFDRRQILDTLTICGLDSSSRFANWAAIKPNRDDCGAEEYSRSGLQGLWPRSGRAIEIWATGTAGSWSWVAELFQSLEILAG
jgi:hypothetical protein